MDELKPKILILRGHINTIRKGMAFLTLKDEKGHESFAECKRSFLKADGITGKFLIGICKQDDELVVSLKGDKSERLLLPHEWAFMSETIEQVLFDNKMHRRTNGVERE
jgi:hypothetical protein